ncbi:MAG: type I-U CRISPR-associated protein Csb2 [Gaiellales bacterium]
MLVLELRFPSGRYHATPWGRHVNEGVPEWPPSPYRLVRALYDTWRRKLPDWPEDEVAGILGALASAPPVFQLPASAASHTRSFLSKNTKVETDRTLIFDAFVTLRPSDSLLIGWPNVRLDSDDERRLSQLLLLLNYLGRSESWVEASVREPCTPDWNCLPANGATRADGQEIVPVACPIPVADYKPDPVKPKAKRRPGAATWMDALAWSTGDIFKSTRSDPPALRHVPYLRPSNCFDVPMVAAATRREPVIHGVLFALESKVLPPVTSTLEVAERVRRKLMGIHRRIVGNPALVSPRFSGKSPDGRPLAGHRHVYLLPLDSDADGRLDHLLAVCREPFDRSERTALDRLERVWQVGGRPDIRLFPLQWGTRADLCPPRRVFRSATPFLPPRHHKRSRGPLSDWLLSEIRREAINHGLPHPTRATPTERLVCGGRSVRWIEFRRNRKDEPASLGYGFELEFAEPVVGPVALGRNSHFGMGLFLPAT